LQTKVSRRIELQETPVPQSFLAIYRRIVMHRSDCIRARGARQKSNGVRAMKVKLTDRFCANVKSASRMEYFDEDMTGLALRVTEAGAKSWTFNYTLDNKRARMTLGTYPVLSLSGARTKAIEARTEVEEGRDPRSTEGETFKKITEDYIKREGNKLRTADQRQVILERLVYPTLGDRSIDEIRRSEIVRLLDKIEDNNGPVMADRTLEIIRKVMNWHASRSDDFRSPIVRGMARTKTSERARKRILTDDELRQVWNAAETAGVFGRLVKFILLTATRRGEAARMTREELKGTDWIIPAARYKTKLDHLVPLSTQAQSLLSDANGFLFATDRGKPIINFSVFKQRLDRASGIAGWTIHDLRRTARSLMNRAGVSSDIAERCLGHVMGGVRGTYDRYEYRDEKAQAFDALASLIDRIVHPQDNVVTLSKAV
jgi:integrase